MHPQVVGVRVAALVVGVGDDHLRPLAADDLDQPADRLVEVGTLANASGSALAGVSGMPESR